MIVRETPALVRACPVKPHIGAFDAREGRTRSGLAGNHEELRPGMVPKG